MRIRDALPATPSAGTALARLLCLSLIVLSASCVPITERPRAQAGTTGVNAFYESGTDVRGHLEKRWNESTIECGSATAPAFVCSGILIRGTSYSADFHAWDINPTSPKTPGVSFSWLRHDSQHVRLAYHYSTGFILYPKKYATDHGFASEINILCAFPIDGDTDTRNSKGCGASRYFPTASAPCQDQSPSITTAAAWRTHFDRNQTPERFRNECGFNVAKGTANSARIFNKTLIARTGLPLVNLGGNASELIVDGWPNDRTGSLPIEAFFYIVGTNGKSAAQSIQKDYKATTGRWVAIIAITLPSAQTGPVSFAYSASDQGTPSP